MITKIAKLTLLLTICTTGITALCSEGGNAAQNTHLFPFKDIEVNSSYNTTVNYVYTAEQEAQFLSNPQSRPTINTSSSAYTRVNIFRARNNEELAAITQNITNPNRTAQYLAAFAGGVVIGAGAFGLKKLLENRSNGTN